MEFEDQNDDLSYCDGDIALEDVDWDSVEKIQKFKNQLESQPDGPEKDFASLIFLHELYGNELDVR